MMSASDPASANELTDGQLDTLLDGADQELLRHVQDNTDLTATLNRLLASRTNAALAAARNLLRFASLVDAAAAGNEHAWYEIVDRYAPLLVSVLRRFGLTAAESRDVAQTVWLLLVEHLGSLRVPEALAKWIIITGSRQSMRCLADRRRIVASDPLVPSWQAEPDAELIRGDQQEALLAGLAELPKGERQLLLILMEDPPLSYAQISRRIGIPIGSIGPTRRLALEQLRQTSAVRDHLIGRAIAPAAPDGAARIAAGDADPPREGREA